MVLVVEDAGKECYAVGRAMGEVERCRVFGAFKSKLHRQTGESRLQRDGEMVGWEVVLRSDWLVAGRRLQVAGRRSVGERWIVRLH